MGERLVVDPAGRPGRRRTGRPVLHEAARAGRVDYRELLVRHGAALELRTTTVPGLGGTARWWRITRWRVRRGCAFCRLVATRWMLLWRSALRFRLLNRSHRALVLMVSS